MLLVAVSGGIDSMCLLEKVRLSGEPFAIAHCNFGLRGADADADEAFVRAWALEHDVRCHVRRFATREFSEDLGISIEMAARKLRYNWFGQLCREHGYQAVAVAHNANDNAETLLLNLLRGTGLRGILGMKPAGFIPDPEYGDIPLFRPLLGLSREQIEAFARENGVQWREDVTNGENSYRRNKIRNQVFPVFREINPSFVQTLNRDMERFAEEISRFDTHTSEPFVASLLVPPTKHSADDQASLLTAPAFCGPLPLMRPRVATGSEVCASNLNYTITEEPWDGTQDVKQPAGMLILDADKAGELVQGPWETGDWIRPLGAPGKKKMQDWFTDHHIPADEKPFFRLFKSATNPHHVLAIAGCCIDHSVRVTRSTRRILRISPGA